MTDNVTAPATGDVFATDDIAGVQYPRTKVGFGTDGAYADVSAGSPLPVTGPLTDAQLRATAVPISGTVTGPLTDGQLRASAVPVSGPLTDAQIRATALPVSGPLTDVQLRATAVPVSGTVSTGLSQPLTDAQLRATAVPVSGPLTDAQIRATALPVSGPLTDTQLRASAVPVSASALPLPTGAATETTLAAMNTKTPALGQAAMAASQPVVIASDQSAIPIVESATVITGQAAQTATINNILPATAGANGTDVSNLRAAVIQVVSTGTAGTFIFEQSNDNVNWVALPVFNAALVTGVPITAAITATASAIVYTFPIRCRFLRLRIATTITGGSIQAFSRLSTEPWTAAAQLVASNTAANLAATVSGTVTANIGTGAIAAGTNAIGDVGIQYRASAAGAGSVVSLNCPATPAVQTIKGSAGRLIGLYLVNTNATIRWLKVFNATAPTLASTAATMRIPLPQNQPVYIAFAGGMGFATAITCAISATGSLTDATGAVTLDDVTGFAVFA